MAGNELRAQAEHAGDASHSSGTAPGFSAEDIEAPAAEVVDPLQRARAVLEDARRQMPGMLGDADDDGPATSKSLAPPLPTDRSPAAWHGALAELRNAQAQFLDHLEESRDRLFDELRAEHQRYLSEARQESTEIIAAFVAERAHLSAEILDLRGLLGDLHGEVLRLHELAQVSGTATPAPADYQPEPLMSAPEPASPEDVQVSEAAIPDEINAGGADTTGTLATLGPETIWLEEPAAIATTDTPMAVDDVIATAGGLEEAANAPLGEEASAIVADSQAPSEPAAPAEQPQAGDAARSVEQLDSLAVSLEQRIRAALARPLPFGVRFSEETPESPFLPTQRNTLEAEQSGDTGGRDRPEVLATERAAEVPLREPAVSDATLAPGAPVTLAVGPLLGVRRLSALEQQLATRLGAAQLELRMYRDGEASFRLRLAREMPVRELLAAVAAAGGRVAACALENDSRSLRVRLALPDEGGSA